MILVATDAAVEGVNLQNANLMVNYDLPWNPNRMEQCFGRIHRIGQTEVCHLWNLVANETREGDVFQRLFDKLENERLARRQKELEARWHITSRTPAHDLRFIGVKGRAAGAKTVTITRNEILTGFNKLDQWLLAVVEVEEDGAAAEPVYVRRPFDMRGLGGSSVNYHWETLAAKGGAPAASPI